ncbi:MAG: serine protease Do [Verrucomicrobiales bacterium]
MLIVSGINEDEDAEAHHAGGFIISASGLALTNHHVIQSYRQGDLLTATTLDGRVVGVREILASNEADDLALIQLDGEGFQPVAIAEGAPVGSDEVAISHPQNAFYTLTKGHISRYCREDNRPRMMITAEFAMGSSGAPVFNQNGAVVGMIEMKRSIAYNTLPGHNDEGTIKVGGKRGSRLFLSMSHQMTLRYIVPCQALRAFLFPQMEKE